MIPIHYISTGTVRFKEAHRTLKGWRHIRFLRIMYGRKMTEPLPVGCYVIEHPEGVIIFDTGELAAAQDTLQYYACSHTLSWLIASHGILEYEIAPEQQLDQQLLALGIHPADVRWVVLSHLHVDHCGGIGLFPNAEFIVNADEYRNALNGINGAAPCLWPEGWRPTPIRYEHGDFGPWGESYRLTEAGDVVLVPTPGHTAAHQSMILRDGDFSFFFAGDLTFDEGQLQRKTLAGIIEKFEPARRSIDKARSYIKRRPTVYLPSHDPDSSRRLAEGIITEIQGK
ncbi:MAG: N-acyl homoserine lactonase family protein [Chloroflexi bacterium]|nr:MAG: N-acyl homoserine lactonase family protein [Chloroflexota bacterium]